MPMMISWFWDKWLVRVDGQGSFLLDIMVAHVCHLVQFQKLKQIFKTRSNNLFTKIMFLENELNIKFKLVFKNTLLGQTHVSICFHPMV
jgi:hypothetical protein